MEKHPHARSNRCYVCSFVRDNTRFGADPIPGEADGSHVSPFIMKASCHESHEIHEIHD
jgi:hypothetical protein